MVPYVSLGTCEAPDGSIIELRQRGHEFLILADGYDLMSSEDDVSSKALAELGCEHIGKDKQARVLVGGLGMGFTLRAALNAVGTTSVVDIAELVPGVVEWNKGPLSALAQAPLADPRTNLILGDVNKAIRTGQGIYDAIMLDVDNGPDALAHDKNEQLYSNRGIAQAYQALRPGGVLAVWSFSDDPPFTKRLEREGFEAKAIRVSASRKGRGRYHVIWVAKKTPRTKQSAKPQSKKTKRS